ncbi:MAG TPA: tRNA (guanosine(46)-N7)-methyltransferase TrmB [Hyphomicrobiaceae bacterium]|nr:tRNA (guanosine(46)-N7)-methyltransferase TrmB [Hyphomicrobiaceae bacterium]
MSNMTTGYRPQDDLRSYGRRRARAPSPRQQQLWREVLPRVAVPTDGTHPVNPLRLFTPPVRDVWLEIGFGGGEHLVWQAKAHAHVGLIGCEPFEDGVIKVLGAIEQDGLTNVRVCADDARPLLRRLPAASLGRVFILFPDPWPKKRHHKRRIVSAATLVEIARVLRLGGELRIATDVSAYATVILDVAAHNADLHWTAGRASDWRIRPPDWPQTRYEAKALAAGRCCYYFRFVRV